MIHIGMDVHQKSTTFCLFDPSRSAAEQYRTLTRPTTAEEVRAVLSPLNGRCRVAFEVGTQTQWIASIVRPLAEEVQVANPSRIPWLFRDGRKNDQLDARKLATLLYLGQLPTVHLPKAEVSAWRALINHRRTLVKRRTIVKNQIRTMVRAFGHCCPFKNLWTHRGQTWLLSLELDDARTVMRTTLLDELTFFDQKLLEIEAKLEAIAAAHPQVALLRTIPGVGPRTAEAIVAFSDGAGRFSNRRRFASYFGMTPAEDSSGGVQRHGHISKRGPSVVRWVLIEAAHQAIKRCAEFRAFYDSLRRGKKDRGKKAIVAVGRKLLAVAYAMMRDQTPFRAEKVRRRAA